MTPQPMTTAPMDGTPVLLLIKGRWRLGTWWGNQQNRKGWYGLKQEVGPSYRLMPSGRLEKLEGWHPAEFAQSN